MKLSLIMAAGIACFTRIASTAEIPFEGKIESVTVFTSGFAQVTRVQDVQLEPGETLHRSKPLPQAADLSTVLAAIQSSGAQTAGVTVLDVETRRELVMDRELEKIVAAFREEYRKQDDTVFLVRQELSAIDEQIQTREILVMLDKMREKTAASADREMTGQRMDAESWRKVIDLAQLRADKARADIRELDFRRRAITRRLADEQKKLAEIIRKAPKGLVAPDPDYSQGMLQLQRSNHSIMTAYDPGSAQTFQTRVFITLAAKSKTSARLALSYHVSGADWTPMYRVYADLKAKTADLNVSAEVRQNSGEDWNMVRLSLSTARPDIGADMPVLLPWYIRTAEPLRSGGSMRFKKMESAAEEESESAPAAPPPPEAPLTEEAPAAGVATVFMAQTKTAIPSDNEAHRISVSSLSSKMDVEHVAIPKILPHAFMQARLANRASFALIPGNVDVFVNGGFVGRGMMKATAPGETIRLSLGVDEQVKIQLKLAEDKGERKVRGGRAQSTNVFEICATNFKDEDVKLTVIDQLPISADGQVTVSYGSDAKRALRGAEFPGQLKWELALAPKKPQTFRFDFTVEYPEHLRQYLKADAVEYNFDRMEAEQQAPSPENASAAPKWGNVQRKGKVQQQVNF
jgi:hypothetical protein